MKLSAEQVLLPHLAKIRDALASGQTSYAALSRTYHVSLEGVSRFVIKHKLPRRPVGRLAGTSKHQPSPERQHLMDECLRLTREGWSANKIGQSLNPPRTREMVRKLLQQAGYKGLWRLVAEDRALVARRIAPMLARGKSRIEIAAVMRDEDLALRPPPKRPLTTKELDELLKEALNEVDVVLTMARGEHYEKSERRGKPEHAYLDDVCAAMALARAAMDEGRVRRKMQQSLERKAVATRRSILKRAVHRAREQGMNMLEISEKAHMPYSSLTAMLGGERGVTLETWSKLAKVLPLIAETPYPSAPEGSEDLNHHDGLDVAENTPHGNRVVPGH